MFARVAELDELFEFRECGTGEDGAISNLGSFEEAFRDARDDEGSGCVHDHDVARWAWLTF